MNVRIWTRADNQSLPSDITELQALELSRDKWVSFSNALNVIHDNMTRKCGLCVRHYDNCLCCPLKSQGFYGCCSKNTPLTKAEDNVREALISVEQMIADLENLIQDELKKDDNPTSTE